MKIKTVIALAAAGLAGLTLTFSALAEACVEWVAPARAAKKKNPLTADAATLAKGKEFYTRECAACHGNTGKGDGPKAGELNPKPRDLHLAAITSQSDGGLFWKLTEGKTPMPTYAKFSEEERWAVLLYVRSLK